MAKDIESARIDLWCQVYVAYVGAANAVRLDGAVQWADIALERFDERFPLLVPPLDDKGRPWEGMPTKTGSL